jgi:CHAT domain-containing protein
LSAIISKGHQLFLSANYRKARAVYEQGLTVTSELAPADRADLILSVANCALATHDYSEALNLYSEVESIAKPAGLSNVLVRAAVNRTTVFRRMRNSRAALDSMREIEPLLTTSQEPLAFAQAATVIRDLEPERANRLYATAVELASQQGDLLKEASIWNQLGYARLLHRDLNAAERALTQAYRLKRSGGNKQLQTTLFYLARLRRLQGDYSSALNLLDSAAEQRDGQFPAASFHTEKALILRDSGDLEGALDAHAEALRSAHEWRMHAVPAESFRVSTESDLEQIYRGYIETAMRQYERTGKVHLAIQAFALAEENRAHLIEASMKSEKRFPPEYWELLTKYQRLLGRSMGGSDPQTDRLLSQYRRQLNEIEARAGSSTNSYRIYERTDSDSLLTRLRRNLRESEALVSFYIGNEVSYRWAVTDKGFEVQKLTAGKEVARKVQQFRETIREKDGERSVRVGSSLYAALFGNLGIGPRSRADWILSLDGPLFEVPFAALVSRTAPLEYLIERHSLRLTTSASVAPRTSEDVELASAFVGIGDPVYNRADPRWKGERDEAASRSELPRLPGTAREIRKCAVAWQADSEAVLLTGVAVNRRNLAAALAKRPAVLHWATHVVSDSTEPDHVLLALGLQSEDGESYIGPAEISAWRHHVGLVTLSGCGSGLGSVLPGLGLFGLTRAWLVSGADTVLATYWPVGDDDGELLSTMYAQLRDKRMTSETLEVAKALQQGQINALRAGGPHHDAARWAAYFVVGKE